MKAVVGNIIAKVEKSTFANNVLDHNYSQNE